MMVAFLAFHNSFKFAGPSYAAGTTGTFAKLAIVTAPRFNETSSSIVLVPPGNMPTTSPDFNNLIGVLMLLGEGFSRLTGKALIWERRRDISLFLNSSCFAIK